MVALEKRQIVPLSEAATNYGWGGSIILHDVVAVENAGCRLLSKESYPAEKI
jgi:hypothetical protein